MIQSELFSAGTPTWLSLANFDPATHATRCSTFLANVLSVCMWTAGWYMQTDPGGRSLQNAPQTPRSPDPHPGSLELLPQTEGFHWGRSPEPLWFPSSPSRTLSRAWSFFLLLFGSAAPQREHCHESQSSSSVRPESARLLMRATTRSVV